MKNTTSRSALIAGVAFAALVATPAMAADPVGPVEAASTEASNPSGVTDAEIVVTATKTSERLIEVPASVSVVTATDLTKGGIVRFADYAAKVPGLSLTSGRTGITQVTLRGITTGAAQPGSTTGYYIDEAPVGSVNAYTGGNAITPDLDPSDLAQIEVLKGPQGTLYGAGAVGGLLKFATTPSDLNEFSARLSAGATSVRRGDGGFSGRGVINIPLIEDGLAVHGSAFYRRDAGYVDNINPRIPQRDVNYAQIRGGRAVVNAKLGPAVRIDVSALLQDTTTNGTNTVDVDAATLAPIYGYLQQNRFIRDSCYNRFRLYNATIRANLGNVDLLSSTTYQRIFYQELSDSTRGFGAALGPLFGLGNTLGVRINTIKATQRWSQEARASSNGLFDGLLDLQAGFYWTRETDRNQIPNIDTFSTVTGATLPLPALAIAKIDSKYQEYSFYGSARVHLGETFDVLGGLRYSHDKQTYLQDYQGLIVGPRLIVPGSEKANITTYMISPRARLSDNLTIYGRVASGYRPGGPNPAPPTGNVPLTFQPDKLTQYEVGLKAQTADRALSVDAALFYTKWNNIQIQTSAGGFNFLVNGGAAKSQGGEVTLRYKPVIGLIIGANAAYTDAKLTTAAPAAGGVDGDRLPYVPRWTGSLSADYSTALSDAVELTAGASVNYVGNRITDYANKFPKRLNGYATVDLRAGLDFGEWSLSAFAKNVGDRRAYNVVIAQALAPSATPGAFYAASVIQPRTVGAELSIKF